MFAKDLFNFFKFQSFGKFQWFDYFLTSVLGHVNHGSHIINVSLSVIPTIDYKKFSSISKILLL